MPEYTEKYDNVEDSEFFYLKREVEETTSKIAPNFVKPLETNCSAPEGSNINLVAQITPVNDPALRIEWTLNGQPLQSDKRINTTFEFGYITLTVTNLQECDSGIYMVKVSNGKGDACSTTSLKVIPG